MPIKNHAAWLEFERIRSSEEKRIMKIANPAERARRLAALDLWAAEESANLEWLIEAEESRRTNTIILDKEYDTRN